MLRGAVLTSGALLLRTGLLGVGRRIAGTAGAAEGIRIFSVTAGIHPECLARLSQSIHVDSQLLQAVDDRGLLRCLEASKLHDRFISPMRRGPERIAQARVANSPPTQVLKFEGRIVVVGRPAALRGQARMHLEIRSEVGGAILNVENCAGD